MNLENNRAPSLSEEDVAELRRMADEHYQATFGMGVEEFNSLDWNVRVAKLERAGVEFAASFGGRAFEGKSRAPAQHARLKLVKE